jgi:hypothetical protein
VAGAAGQRDVPREVALRAAVLRAAPAVLAEARRAAGGATGAAAALALF